MHKQTLKIQSINDNIGESVLFIETALKNMGYSGKKLSSTILTCEEIMVQMVINTTSPDSQIYIHIDGNGKKAKVKISCKGNKISFNNTSTVSQIADLSDMEDDQVAIISRMIINAYTDNISVKYLNGLNVAYVKIEEKKRSTNMIIVCMILGALAGLVLRMLVPVQAAQFISSNIFSVISTLFLNAIKMVVAPLIFFSIAESMTGFSDYGTFGRIGGKIIGLYFFTTVIAISIAFGVVSIMKPGDPSLLPAVLEVIGSTTTKTTVPNVSIIDTIIGIVPSNLATAFVTTDMLQIIFLGVIVGIASGLLGEQSMGVQKFLKNGNALFSKITTMIIKTMPVSVFCIVANIALTIGMESLFSLLHVYVTFVVGIFLMFSFYLLFLAIAGKRINPFKFFSKYKDAIIMAFTTCSSSATIPVSMRSLDNLGVSKKIYAFSIPLGATINMDGASVGFVIITMFMARIFSVQMNGSLLLSLFLSVMLLAIGTPAIPGAGFACMAMLFSQIGVPPEAVGYTIIVLTLGDFFTTASNVVGDAVVTTVVASSEKLLDLKKYNG